MRKAQTADFLSLHDNASDDTQSQTLTALNAKHLQVIPYTKHSYWRGQQTSPTEVSLKGRLLEIIQSTSTLSCDVIQIHSLFRHGFIKKPKSKFNRNRK